MDYETIIRRYLHSMESGDLNGVTTCFTAAGIVISPVYGTVPVKDFYIQLFDDTRHAKVEIDEIYKSVATPNHWAAHFAYTWVKADGSTISTDLVDLFDFDIREGLINSLKIIFDAKPNR